VEATADAIAAASFQDPPSRNTTTKVKNQKFWSSAFNSVVDLGEGGLVEWGGGKRRQQGLPHHHLPIRHLSTEKPNSLSSDFKLSGDRWKIRQGQKLIPKYKKIINFLQKAQFVTKGYKSMVLLKTRRDE
jgi:hypothetical protein